MTLQVGDEVTIRPPYSGYPIVVEMQHHVRIVEIRPNGYMVELPSAVELTAYGWRRQRVGPLPASELVAGWRDEHGRWQFP